MMTNKQFIKESLRERLLEFEDKKMVGGVLIKCIKTGNVFLLERNDPSSHKWALISGGIEPGEKVLDGLKREIYEELFLNPGIIQFKFIRIEYIVEKNMEFHYYEGFVQDEFKPILDSENLNFGWYPKDKLPSPLYQGLAEKIKNI